jgi:glycosyltransferase involved in cell wall biosynthesis
MNTQMSQPETNSAIAARIRTTKLTPHICVCICTFRRPELLNRLLGRLLQLQKVADLFTLSCVVVDNDEDRSAAEVVSLFENSGMVKFIYQCEPERNFAVVRNRAVRASSGDYIAFIDDDEIPERDWLLRLLETCERYGCDGALGPVRPYFEKRAPCWLEKSGLCDRPVHPTGLVLDWQQTRSGNVLLRRDIFEPGGIWFDPAYRTGGEDVDFFKRVIAAGRKFVWCEEAPAYELVPVERMRLAYHLRRALLQGGISLKYGLERNHFADRVRIGLKSFLAIGIYTLAIPFLLLGGFRPFINCLVKLCHHLGRFSALCGRPILRERKL